MLLNNAESSNIIIDSPAISVDGEEICLQCWTFQFPFLLLLQIPSESLFGGRELSVLRKNWWSSVGQDIGTNPPHLQKSSKASRPLFCKTAAPAIRFRNCSCITVMVSLLVWSYMFPIIFERLQHYGAILLGAVPLPGGL